MIDEASKLANEAIKFIARLDLNMPTNKIDLERMIKSLSKDIEFGVSMDKSIKTKSTILSKKGFVIMALYRLSNAFYTHKDLIDCAEEIHKITSMYLAVDIHPGANIASGVYIDHATSVVIGETVTIGSQTLIYHGVTLGSIHPEFEREQRHPTLLGGNIIGCGAKILGPLVIERYRNVPAGSILKWSDNEASH